MPECFSRIGTIHRRGHRDDDEIGLPDARRIVGHAKPLGGAQFLGRHLAGRVLEALQPLDLAGRKVEADRGALLAEGDRDGQPDVAQADHAHRREACGFFARRVGEDSVVKRHLEHGKPPSRDRGYSMSHSVATV